MTEKTNHDQISKTFQELYIFLDKYAEENNDVLAEEVLGHVAEAQAIWLNEN
jgi:hypothetical protein